jgi:hypothetical protein
VSVSPSLEIWVQELLIFWVQELVILCETTEVKYAIDIEINYRRGQKPKIPASALARSHCGDSLAITTTGVVLRINRRTSRCEVRREASRRTIRQAAFFTFSAELDRAA